MSSPSSSSSSSSSIKPRDKWFNLALRDCPGVRESTDFWRHSNLEPMVVDVILVKRPNSLDPVSNSPRRGLVRNASNDRFPSFWNADNDEFGFETKADKIIERWVVQYESRKSGRDSSSGTKRSSGTSSHILYKKSILLLRSLYAMIRLLPVYKLFRDLNSSSQVLTYNLSHRVSSFVEPFTRREESGMQRFEFTPVDTFCGRLCLSVLYRSSFSDVSSEPSTPITPQFIPDYVGSPLADRSKRFQSFSPFGRRHSWSYDLYAASPPSEFPSPSPTYSDSRVSVSKPSSHRLPPSSLPRYLPGTPPFKREHKTFDEFGPSPAFSPSTSPSPPASLHGNQIPTTLLRSESAPVSIPGFKVGGASSSNKGQILPPSPPFKGSRPSASRVERSSGLVQTNSIVDKVWCLIMVNQAFWLFLFILSRIFVFCSSPSENMKLEGILGWGYHPVAHHRNRFQEAPVGYLSRMIWMILSFLALLLWMMMTLLTQVAGNVGHIDLVVILIHLCFVVFLLLP